MILIKQKISESDGTVNYNGPRSLELEEQLDVLKFFH